MKRLTAKLVDRALGSRNLRMEGARRSLRGLREANRRELTLGLALSAISYLRRTTPKKQLIYRKKVPTGTALVIHHKKRDAPGLEIRRGP
ncbi:MAG TPA: hypothetical protein VE569_05075 [Acidimicrobiia bacterium]|nr:hypothetical protein [Acidimicrobiia bacterium]